MDKKKVVACSAGSPAAARNKLAKDLTYSLGVLQKGAPVLPEGWYGLCHPIFTPSVVRSALGAFRMAGIVQVSQKCYHFQGNSLGTFAGFKTRTSWFTGLGKNKKKKVGFGIQFFASPAPLSHSQKKVSHVSEPLKRVH